MADIPQGIVDVWMQHPTLRHSNTRCSPHSGGGWGSTPRRGTAAPRPVAVGTATHRPHYYPLFATCVDLGVPFCTQVGHTGPLHPSETGRPLPHIDQVAIGFPELTIVCGHIGHPWTTEMIAVADKHANVYIDTSAYTVKRYPQELVDYMNGRGRTKVLFGTNYPMLTAARAPTGLDRLGLGEETTELFVAGNARRVFGL